MVRFGELINASLQWTLAVLFRPFKFKKWMILGFVALMAGQLAGGGNFNGDLPSKKTKDANAAVVLAKDATSQEKSVVPAQPVTNTADQFKQYLPIIIAVVLFIAIPFLILMTWLGARFSFVFMQDVVQNDASIKIPFRENKREGNSLFVFSLLLMLIFLILLGIDAYFCIAKLNAMGALEKDAHIGFMPIFLAVLPYVIILLLILLLSAIVHIIVYDFAIVIMHKDKIRIAEALSRFLKIFTQHRGVFVKYFFIKIGLGICAWIGYSIISLAVTLILLLPAIIIGLTLYFLYSSVRPLAYIVGFGLVLPAFIFVSYCFMCMYLPFAVFFRTFSVKLIGRLEGRYNLFKFS